MTGTDAICRKAVDALGQALEDRPDRIYEDMACAMRCLVNFRDALIERQREGKGDRGARDRLQRTNAILSIVVGGEYPLVGVRENRIKQARDELAQLLEADDLSG
jgi:hypothetical protein